MSDIANVITAICAVLGTFGAFSVWLKSRTPAIIFSASRIFTSHIYRITLYPKRIEYVYSISEIKSKHTIYAEIKIDDKFFPDKIDVVNALNSSDLHCTVQSCHQSLEQEPYLESFVDLKGYKDAVYRMTVSFKLERFPYYWRKTIDIPVG